MNNNIDWIIHLVANGACDECGKEEKDSCPIPAMRILMAWRNMATRIFKWS